MNKATFPLLIITAGTGWLLNSSAFQPEVDWTFMLLIAMFGIIFMINGINRISVICGPWLIIASLLYYLRKTAIINDSISWPILVIVLGILMMISRFSNLPDSPKDPSKTTEPKNNGD